jgi:hypothetical protein
MVNLKSPLKMLPSVEIDLLRISMNDITNDFSISEINPQHKPHSRWSYLLYVGAAYPFEVQTFEEQAFHFGISIKYNLYERLRLKSHVSFHNMNFISEMINPRIGIKSVQAPFPNQKFSTAELESSSINASIGLEYLLVENMRWGLHFGTSYLVAKEIIKDVDYIFLGPDNTELEDDSIVSLHNEERYFAKNIINIELSAGHHFAFGDFHYGFSYPLQLNKSKIDLVNQLQLNVGLMKKF